MSVPLPPTVAVHPSPFPSLPHQTGAIDTAGAPAPTNVVGSSLFAHSASTVMSGDFSLAPPAIVGPSAPSLPFLSDAPVGVAASSTSFVAPSAVTRDRSDVFLSYAWGAGPGQAGKPFALALATCLRVAGYSVWLDVDMASASAADFADFEEAVALGIANASAVVLVLSDAYAASVNCRKEARFAREAKKPLFFVNGGAPGYMPNGFDHADVAAIRTHTWLSNIVGEALWSDCRAAAAIAAAGGAPEAIVAAIQTPSMMLLQQLAADDRVTLTGGDSSGSGSAAAAVAPMGTISWTALVPTDEKLGSGSFSDVGVFLYHHERVAVKVLRDPGASLSSAAIAKFVNEAKLQARLEHKNVARVYGLAVDVTTQRYGLVMRLYRAPLSRAIAEVATPAASAATTPGATLLLSSLHRRVDFCAQLASGLAYLHASGVVHGDVKPANVLVSLEGDSCAISDFGFASIRTDSSASDSGQKGGGTQLFMAPELFETDEETGDFLHGSSRAADVYAFAIAAFCILACTLSPYPRIDQQGRRIILFLRVPRGLRPDINALPFEISSVRDASSSNAVADLLQSCWQSDPSRRPPMNEVAQKVATFVAHFAAGAAVSMAEPARVLSSSTAPISSVPVVEPLAPAPRTATELLPREALEQRIRIPRNLFLPSGGAAESPHRRHVFLSHSQITGGDLALALSTSLLNLDVTSWHDLNMTPFGLNAESMREGVRLCDLFCLLLTPGAFTRPAVCMEIAEAFAQRKRIVLLLPRSDPSPTKELDEMKVEVSAADALAATHVVSSSSSSFLLTKESLDYVRSSTRLELHSGLQLHRISAPQIKAAVMSSAIVRRRSLEDRLGTHAMPSLPLRAATSSAEHPPTPPLHVLLVSIRDGVFVEYLRGALLLACPSLRVAALGDDVDGALSPSHPTHVLAILEVSLFSDARAVAVLESCTEKGGPSIHFLFDKTDKDAFSRILSSSPLSLKPLFQRVTAEGTLRDVERRWPQLCILLQGLGASVRVSAFPSPPLPSRFNSAINAHALVNLKSEIEDGSWRSLVCGGPDGLGASTVAAALALDEEIRDRFDDILWARFARGASALKDVFIFLVEMLRALGGGTGQDGDRWDVKSLASAVRNILDQPSRRVLIVFDHIFVEPTEGGGSSFIAEVIGDLVPSSGSSCLLVTTNNVDFCSRRCSARSPSLKPFAMDPMAIDAASELLLTASGIRAPPNEPMLRALVEAVGCSPFAVQLVAHILRQARLDRYESVGAAFDHVRSNVSAATLQPALAAAAAAAPIYRTIEVTLARCLSAADRDSFCAFGLFSVDADIPLALLLPAWGRSASGDCNELINRFVDAALLARVVEESTGTIAVRLHPLVWDFVKAEQPAAANPALRQMQRSFLDRAKATICDASGSWVDVCDIGDVPAREYLLRHLPQHLAAAGRHTELLRLYCTVDWLSASISRWGLHNVLADAAELELFARADWGEYDYQDEQARALTQLLKSMVALMMDGVHCSRLQLASLLGNLFAETPSIIQDRFKILKNLRDDALAIIAATTSIPSAAQTAHLSAATFPAAGSTLLPSTAPLPALSASATAPHPPLDPYNSSSLGVDTYILFGKYKLDYPEYDKAPMHVSPTSVVFSARMLVEPSGGGSGGAARASIPVVIKFLFDKTQFEKEMEGRRTMKNPEATAQLWANFSPLGARDVDVLRRLPFDLHQHGDAAGAIHAIIMDKGDKNLLSVIGSEWSDLRRHVPAVIRDIGLGLKSLHDNRVTHGDVKPRNIVRFDGAGSSLSAQHAATASPMPAAAALSAVRSSHYRLIDLDASRSFEELIGPKLSTAFTPPEALDAPTACSTCCKPGLFSWKRGRMAATAAADSWGLGATLYHMLTCQTLFQTVGVDAIGSDEIDNPAALAAWSDQKLDAKLHRQQENINAHAGDLLRKLLALKPASRLSMDGVLAHPFVTGAAGAVDERFEYDVFISHRWGSDDALSRRLYKDLEREFPGRVFMDAHKLGHGNAEGYRVEFCKRLVSSRVFLPVVSRAAVERWNVPPRPGAGPSQIDNVLLEYRLAQELFKEHPRAILPLFVGTPGGLFSASRSFLHDRPLGTPSIDAAVEENLRDFIVREELGPRPEKETLNAVLTWISEKNGYEIARGFTEPQCTEYDKAIASVIHEIRGRLFQDNGVQDASCCQCARNVIPTATVGALVVDNDGRHARATASSQSAAIGAASALATVDVTTRIGIVALTAAATLALTVGVVFALRRRSA